jgi:hypothetical protein
MTKPSIGSNDSTGDELKIALICHVDDPLSRDLLPHWLASFSTLVGMVLIDEDRGAWFRRLRAEYRRVGPLHLLDIFAFRVYYRLFLAAQDNAWERAEIRKRCALLPNMIGSVPALLTSDPNDEKVAKFLRDVAPQLIIARCKWLLREGIYRVPLLGTFVLHPGICPQYRNAHGCFWAIANRDLANVGLTLLQIDAGIDTGPIYGFFRYPFDELSESHIRIQQRVLLENLDAVRAVLLDIGSGRALPIEVSGFRSRNWGQPWLSAYLRARRDARRLPP